MFRICLVFVALAAVGVSAGGNGCSSGPDLCASPIILNDANGNFLMKLCVNDQEVTWASAQEFCKSIGYTLFRIDSSAVENSFYNFLISNQADGFDAWINGNANIDGTWELVDPNGPYRFMNITTANGACLAYRYTADVGFVYHGVDCGTTNHFICGKQGC